jgi:tripeptidyl-peptidase I
MSNLLRSFFAAFSVVTCCRGLLTAPIEDQALNIQSRGDQRSAKTHIYKEGMPLLSSRSDLVKRADIHHDHAHELVFAVKQNNIDELERALHDVSDPASPNYGQHWSGEQVGAMTSNPQARDATVSYLLANGATIKSESRYGEYITAVAPVSTWDKVLNTQFFNFHQRQLNGDIKETIRAEAYSIPIELHEHLAYVLNAIEMPVRVTMKGETYEAPAEYTTSKKSSKSHMDTSRYSYGFVLPHDLRRYYNFSTSHGSALSTQEAYAGGDDWLNPEDVALFQSLDHIKLSQPAIAGPFGHVSSDPAVMGPNGYHGEGNLDIQYLIAMSPGSPTIYGWHPSSISCWMLTMTDMLAPPRVLSISYGLEEVYNSDAEYDQFNTEVIKLSLRGTTLLAASGDDGAVSGASRGGALYNCGYYPLFPASHPYVVAVGATSVSTIGITV